MLSDRKKRILALTFGAAFLFMAISPIVSQGIAIPADLSIGPYVDKVVYKVIDNEDQRILALQSGEIEMDNSFFNPVHLPALDADPEISIFSALRNGYGHITINCGKYPLNISAFRRAFAYAFDKTRVTTEVMSGFNQEQDSLVPYPNSFCIEDEMPYHYYTAQVEIGNQILNDSHFDIDPVTGWRNAPDGTPFNVVIEYGAAVAVVGGGTAQIGVDALHALHVNAETKASDFNEYISRLDSHGDYDMVFFAYNYLTNDVSWLAYRYWSEYADTPYQNPSNFRNATYDGYRDALLYGTTYEEVYEAAKQMQLILQYNVPLLVVYENTYMQAYRNDKFEGHVGDLTRYISGPWTFRHIKPIGATHGGTVSIAIGEEPDSFNIFTTNSAYSAAILDELWPSLYARAPDVSPYPDIAESLVTETHSTNPLVPDGHTRFTIDIIQNATWSDGQPLTADDVAFTFTYAFESYAYGNPAGVGLTDLVSAYAPTPYQVVIEFSTESYWHFSNFAYTTIIPEHIFNDVDGVGYAGWNTWNPVFDPAQPNVNCGPYTFTDYDAGNFYEISANPSFYHYPVFPPETTTTTTTAPPPDMTLAIVAGAVGAAVVILIGGFVLLRQK